MPKARLVIADAGVLKTLPARELRAGLAEMRALIKAGAVGEIVGWAFDAAGQLIEGHTNDRVASVALDQPAERLVVAVAMGVFKAKALKAALAGRFITGLITNETTAELLL